MYKYWRMNKQHETLVTNIQRCFFPLHFFVDFWDTHKNLWSKICWWKSGFPIFPSNLGSYRKAELWIRESPPFPLRLSVLYSKNLRRPIPGTSWICPSFLLRMPLWIFFLLKFSVQYLDLEGYSTFWTPSTK